MVLRHSLGCGQAVYRCTRCFRTYDRLQTTAAEPSTFRGRMARVWSELRTWREEDE
jgi:transposase-like protein